MPKDIFYYADSGIDGSVKKLESDVLDKRVWPKKERYWLRQHVYHPILGVGFTRKIKIIRRAVSRMWDKWRKRDKFGLC